MSNWVALVVVPESPQRFKFGQFWRDENFWMYDAPEGIKSPLGLAKVGIFREGSRGQLANFIPIGKITQKTHRLWTKSRHFFIFYFLMVYGGDSLRCELLACTTCSAILPLRKLLCGLKDGTAQSKDSVSLV